jgi:hypothetical protein
MMEVAKGVAHPPSGLHHNNKISPDYIRVEVHSMKPEFMQWKIDHPTPERLTLLREVMNQFILWHKRDIVLTASSPHVQRLEGLLRRGRYFHHLMTTTCLRCHILPYLLASMCMRCHSLCHSLPRLLTSTCLRCHSLLRLIRSKGLLASTCLQKKFMHKRVPARSQNFGNRFQSP